MRSGRAELSRDRGAVSLLRTGCLPGLARRGLRLVVLHSEDRRICRADLRILYSRTHGHSARRAAENLWVWCATIFWLMSRGQHVSGQRAGALQRNLKRLLAYSSVAHAGYMLVGLAVGQPPERRGGSAGPVVLLGRLRLHDCRGFRSARSCCDVSTARRKHRRPGRLEPNASGGGRQPWPFCSSASPALPPTVGFLGKLNLLMAAWSQGTTVGRNPGVPAGHQRGDRGRRIICGSSPSCICVRRRQDVETSAQLPAVIGVALCVAVSLGLFFFPGFLWNLVDQFAA